MLISSFDKTIHICKIVRIVLVDIYFNDKMKKKKKNFIYKSSRLLSP